MREVIQRIKDSQNFVVTSHINPDGDNVGSSVAMAKFLKNLGKNAVHYLEDEIPENLKYLLENHKICNNLEEVLEIFGGKDFDLIILDSADKHRVAVNAKILELAESTLNLDHHVSNTGYADINYVMPSISATAEVVTEIFRNIDENLVDEEVATAAYTGISTDTGNFLFPSVTESTFLAAAFLTKKGARRTQIANELYRNTSLEIRTLTKLLLETFTIENEVGVMIMTTEALKESGVDYKDTEAVTNLGVDTKGVEIGILIKENAPRLYKISLRSKGSANVCEIAQKFGGGGHHNAAGCTMEGEAMEIKAQLQKLAEEQIKKDKANA